MGDIKPSIALINDKIKEHLKSNRNSFFFHQIEFLEYLIEELGKIENPEPPKQGFLLLAQNGTHPPRYEHEYYDEAETEAKRLALLTKGYVHILHKVATLTPSYQAVITTVEYKGKTSETKEEIIDLTRDSDLPF